VFGVRRRARRRARCLRLLRQSGFSRRGTYKTIAEPLHFATPGNGGGPIPRLAGLFGPPRRGWIRQRPRPWRGTSPRTTPPVTKAATRRATFAYVAPMAPAATSVATRAVGAATWPNVADGYETPRRPLVRGRGNLGQTEIQVLLALCITCRNALLSQYTGQQKILIVKVTGGPE
jgi:hypothetical protein